MMLLDVCAMYVISKPYSSTTMYFDSYVQIDGIDGSLLLLSICFHCTIRKHIQIKSGNIWPNTMRLLFFNVGKFFWRYSNFYYATSDSYLLKWKYHDKMIGNRFTINNVLASRIKIVKYAEIHLQNFLVIPRRFCIIWISRFVVTREIKK